MSVQDEAHQTPTATDGVYPRFRFRATEVREFIAHVLRVYHRRFWLFIRLVAPAMFVGYLAIRMGTVKYPVAPAEMWLTNLTGYFLSWMASLFSFGATCSAVQQMEAGNEPSAKESFAQVHKRSGSLLRLGLLLFFLYLMAGIVTTLLLWVVVWLFTHFHAYLSGSFWVFSFGIKGLALVVLSRFALAVPLVVLDDSKVGKAMFHSDELTEGKWPQLAALAAKSLIGGIHRNHDPLLAGGVDSGRHRIAVVVSMGANDSVHCRRGRSRAHIVHWLRRTLQTSIQSALDEGRSTCISLALRAGGNRWTGSLPGSVGANSLCA